MVDECESPPPSCYSPEVTIAFVDPTPGIVDARQPYELSGPENSQGIDTIVVAVDQHTGADCWRFDPRPNAPGGLPATSVSDKGNSTYAVFFPSPTLPGVNTLLYRASTGQVTDASFIGHPGNVDGGPFADADDVTAHQQCCLEGVTCGPEYNQYRCDINHSQTTTAEDLVRMVDLLNGADGYDPQLGTPLPHVP
jgi:hypothetical protein